MALEFSFSDDPKSSLNVHFVFEGEKKLAPHVPDSFIGKKLDSVFLPEKQSVVISLGKKEELKTENYRKAASKAVKIASAYKIPSVHFSLGSLSGEQCIAIFEGAYLGNYYFDKYKAQADRAFRVKKIVFPLGAKKFSDVLHESLVVCKNVVIARDLVSDNSNLVTPDLLEKVSREVARKGKMQMKVIRGKKLKNLGLNLIYDVGKAGTSEPRIVVLEYQGNKSSREKIMFAGKGVCFDTGGLNIKTGDFMRGMHMDMAGAAAVIGIMKSVSELKLKKNIIGILGCAENLVDSKSYRPNDVIKSYSGLTVENMNTDAEGRLVLADVLFYGVKKYNPALVIEYSTLTGSVVRSLGSYCAGMVSTSKEFSDKMFEAGMDTYERVWNFPLFDEYLEEVVGDKSDLKSLNKTGNNGAIFGGAFLSKFVEGKPFIHLDIAGTGMLDEGKDYLPKGGTGFGIRLAIEFLKKI